MNNQHKDPLTLDLIGSQRAVAARSEKRLTNCVCVCRPTSFCGLLDSDSSSKKTADYFIYEPSIIRTECFGFLDGKVELIDIF